ncbi:hypothetical protein [Nevskia sp.]|uniref:hypothetical protein n=1 Tax=Nevskia sp. TaxID=1929292 RepID=UPI0025F027E5|nr:hypothetical protein [Nevskia sp.]
MLTFFTVALWGFAANAIAGDQSRKIQSLGGLEVGELRAGDYEAGCGCGFYYPAEKKGAGSFIISWELGGPAVMFTRGNLHKLQPAADIPYASALGEKQQVSLSSQQLSVAGTLTSVWVCPKDSEGCEVSEFTGPLTIEAGTIKSKIAVWVSCGC